MIANKSEIESRARQLSLFELPPICNNDYCYADSEHHVAFTVNEYWADTAALYYIHKGLWNFELASLAKGGLFSKSVLLKEGFEVISSAKPAGWDKPPRPVSSHRWNLPQRHFRDHKLTAKNAPELGHEGL